MTRLTTFVAGAILTALGLGAAVSMPEDAKAAARWKGHQLLFAHDEVTCR
jgi:hypothetical protein